MADLKVALEDLRDESGDRLVRQASRVPSSPPASSARTNWLTVTGVLAVVVLGAVLAAIYLPRSSSPPLRRHLDFNLCR